MLLKCLAVAIAIFFINPQQQPSPDLSKRVIEVLNSTADEAKKWDDKAIAARTQAQIADLIWDTDADHAITYLKTAWAATAAVEEPKRERSTVVNSFLRHAVRREVLLVARKRAPELAEKWLDEIVEESKSAEKTEQGTFDDRTVRSAVMLQMAQQLVADDPKAAADLLIESLRDGVSFNFQNVLLRLQQKDAALAETVLRAAIGRLKSAGMIDPNELLTLYSYLFTPGRVFGANTADNRNQTQLALGGSRVSVPFGRQNLALGREFLEVASDLLLTATVPDGPYALITARRLVSTIGTLFREMREQLPDKAALLQARAQQLDSEARFSTAPIPRKPDMPDIRPGESKESLAERRVDLLEQSAANGPDLLTRDVGYAKAAVATTVERYERGLDLAGKVDDKFLRDGVRNWLLYRAALHLIGSGNLDEARRLNLKNEDAAARAVCLVAGAQKLVKDNDTDRAGEWLREAGMLVRKSDANESMARIALGIVSTYGSFDTQASLDWLLFAVKLMRKTEPADLSDDQAPELKRIRSITSTGEFTNSTSGFSLQAAVGIFPRNQFEQVLNILNDITPREARGVAVLTLCRNFLRSQSQS
jgi:hypothetical protein